MSARGLEETSQTQGRSPGTGKAQKKSGQDERKDWGGRSENEEAKDRRGPDNAENMYEG